MTKEFRYFYPLRVRFAETDLQGHVFFGTYFTYFDVAALEYMRAIGYSYQTMTAEGVDMVYASSHCDYLDRAFFDETLHVYTRIGHVGNTSLRFEFLIKSAEDDRTIARGNIVAVMVDAKEMRPIRVPDSFRQAIRAFEQGGDVS